MWMHKNYSGGTILSIQGKIEHRADREGGRTRLVLLDMADDFRCSVRFDSHRKP